MSEATRRVGELKTAVQAAKDRVAEFDAARKEGVRRVERARAELMEFYRRQGRGDEPDSDLPLGRDPSTTDLAMGVVSVSDAGLHIEGDPEIDLVNALRDAEGGLKARVAQYPMGAGQSDVALEAFDQAAEERYAGAVELLEEREQDLRDFVSANLDQITVERAPIAGSIRNQCVAMLSDARGIGDAWERFRTQEVELLNLADRADLIEQIPPNPLRWVQEVGEPGLPMPESFTG